MVGADPVSWRRYARGVLFILFALLLVGSGTAALTAARARLASATESHTTSAARRVDLERAERQMAERLPRYREWVARGVIVEGGGEAEWMETLSPLEQKVPVTRRRLDPAVPFAPVPGVRSQGAEVRTSPRHEGELVAWVNALKASNVGLVRVTGCTLTSRGATEGALAPLEAVCRLVRLTVPLEKG